MQHIPGIKYHLLTVFTMQIKNQSIQGKYCPSGLLFSPHSLSQPVWDVTWKNWIKSVESNAQCLKTTVFVIVLHGSGNYSSQPTSLTLESMFYSFTETDVWCVNRATEPKQNKTFELEIQATNMCFQSGHSQHPTGFHFNFTQQLPCCKITLLFLST